MAAESVTLPRHLQIFLALIKPVRLHLYSAMERCAVPSVEQPSFLTRLPELIEPLKKFAENLDRTVNRRMGIVVQRSDATDAEIASAVRDFEQELRRLLSACDYVRALKVCDEDVRARALLEDAYLHLLRQIRDWLDELVDILSDPLGNIKKRGLPISGYVEIPINLTLAPAPQLAQLTAWAGARREKLEVRIVFDTSPSTRQAKGFGVLGTLCAIWMGWEIGEHLFGKDDD